MLNNSDYKNLIRKISYSLLLFALSIYLNDIVHLFLF